MENFCTLFCLESDVALYNAFGVFHLLSWQAFIYSVVDLFSLLNLSMRACSSLFCDSKFNFLPWPWEGESAGKAQGWHVPASWWVGVAPSKEARRAEGEQIHHAGWHIRWMCLVHHKAVVGVGGTSPLFFDFPGLFMFVGNTKNFCIVLSNSFVLHFLFLTLQLEKKKWVWEARDVLWDSFNPLPAFCTAWKWWCTHSYKPVRHYVLKLN